MLHHKKQREAGRAALSEGSMFIPPKCRFRTRGNARTRSGGRGHWNTFACHPVLKRGASRQRVPPNTPPSFPYTLIPSQLVRDVKRVSGRSELVLWAESL